MAQTNGDRDEIDRLRTEVVNHLAAIMDLRHTIATLELEHLHLRALNARYERMIAQAIQLINPWED